VAVLTAHYYLRGMWEIALEIRIGKTGRVSVVDDKGMLIADPKPTRVLGKINLLHLPPVKPVLSGRNAKALLTITERARKWWA